MNKIFFLISIIFILGFVHAQNVSIDDAQFVLEESAGIINELSAQGFPVASINDSYSEALLVFQQVAYANVLRNSSIADSDPAKVQARQALGFVNWKNISYSDIFYYTDNIKQYRTDSYNIFDSFSALNKKIQTYKDQGINVSSSENLLKLANSSFYNGQIKESLAYIEQARAQIETDFESASSINVLAKNAKNFFVRYIYWIIFALLIIFMLVYFIVKRIMFRLLKKKIAKMETEEKVLNNLIKKTQVERYRQNKISGLIYNIRMKKYQERLSEIKQDLPILKKHLYK